MPLYEYECDKCGRFEVWQSITSTPLSECPKCGGRTRKLIAGSVGIIFKGSGFHCTDYRKKTPEEGAGRKEAGDAKEPSKAGGESGKKE
ncbi:MAG: hypothetical protein NUV93_06725 [Firmicutes bacterium]|jgi:putative FmdB family regulatory protein|nr:hypothetical protein [Bacillota bacterium]